MAKNTRRMHVVPRFWLRQFADDADRIGMTLVESGRRLEVSTSAAGVRTDIYRRDRPDGSHSDDVERVSIGAVEDDAAPIIRTLRDRWPLGGQEKVELAMFIGLQVMRVPRWFAWHEELLEEALVEQRQVGAFEPNGEWPDGTTEPEVWEANRQFFHGSTRVLLQMLQLSATAASAIGSMNWTLVEFDQPRLAISDHPVIFWPAAIRARRPQRTRLPTFGLVDCLEVRLPISPTLALLATWRDAPDTAQPIAGRRQHAGNINAFTVAEADKQWFHTPGRRPRISSGKLTPLSSELLADYSPQSAADCQLRQMVERDLRRRSGDGSRRAEIHYWPPDASSSVVRSRRAA